METGEHRCAECYWREACGNDEACTCFDPLEDRTEQIIEENRRRFYHDWALLMEEYDG